MASCHIKIENTTMGSGVQGKASLAAMADANRMAVAR
jgi:hypothetical protein